MKKFIITIEEKRYYQIEVEAKTEEQAEELAFYHGDFINGISDDTDAAVYGVVEVGVDEE